MHFVESKVDLSVIIPCYNQGAFIEDAIRSVYHSKTSYTVECIVVNDGSTDGVTKSILDSLNLPNLKVIHQENHGLGNARNVAIKHSAANLILPLDSDNKITENFINEAIALLKSSPEIDIVYSDRFFFYSNSSKKIYKSVGNFNPNLLLLNNYIDACSIYRKKVWELNNGYAEDMPIMGFEDWEFWVHSYKNKQKFHYIPKALYYYRDQPNGMMKTATSKVSMASRYILQKHSDLYSQHLAYIGYSYRYMKKKPLIHFIRNLFNRPFDPRPIGY